MTPETLITAVVAGLVAAILTQLLAAHYIYRLAEEATDRMVEITVRRAITDPAWGRAWLARRAQRRIWRDVATKLDHGQGISPAAADSLRATIKERRP